MKHGIIATLALAFIVMLGVTVCYGTLITAPAQISLSGGKESKGAWMGGYWVFTVAVDQADALSGSISLPANTSKNFDNGTRIETRKNVEIQVTPQSAYYKRTLKLMSVADRIVAPAVYSGGINIWGFGGYDTSKAIDPTVVNTYTWAEASWEKYTLFNVTVTVDGKVAGSSIFNTETGTKDLSIPTTNGTILVKNLGRLEGDYSEPQVASDIVIFDGNYIYSGDALNYIRYDAGRTLNYWCDASNQNIAYLTGTQSFATYWFGNCIWNPTLSVTDKVKETPAPFKYGDSTNGYAIADPAKGWKADDYLGGWKRDPISPNIFPENGSDSLIDYLNLKTSAGNIAKSWMNGYQWNLQYQKGQPNAVIVSLPWGAYSGTPLVTFYVPSELCDTWVYTPPIANVKVLKTFWTNGSDISDNATCTLILKQESTVTSSARIQTSITSRAVITPTSAVVTMEPNSTLALNFTIGNLGVTEDTGGTVTFNIQRSWDSLETDSASLTFTLKKPVVPDNITDTVTRPSQSTIDPTPRTVPEFPWITMVAMMCATTVLVALIVAVAKTRAIKKKDVQTTLVACGKLGKTGAKETLKLGKAVWKSSRTLRTLTGMAAGVGMMITAIFVTFLLPLPFGSMTLLGFIHVNIVTLISGLMIGTFGLLLGVLCFARIFL